MRLQLHAQPGEVAAKSTALLEGLIKALQTEAPELAAALAKAMPAPPLPDELDYPVLQGLRVQMQAEYGAQMQAMLREVGKVLDRTSTDVQKGSLHGRKHHL